MIGLLRSEIIKMKWSAIPYLIGFVILLIGGIMYLSHSLDSHMVIQIGDNPWDKYFRMSFGMFSFILLIPLTVLTVSSSIYTEHNADAWKYLYTLPKSRMAIYFSKLLSLLSVIAVALIGVMLVTLLTGYLLALSFPEMEFTYYQPDFMDLIESLGHTFISLLGVIGLQFFLSLRFKNILLPTGLGLLGFVVGLIVTTIPKKAILFFPYTLPMIAQDFGMTQFDHRISFMSSWLTNVEMYSIVYFLFFVGLGCLIEMKRNVH